VILWRVSNHSRLDGGGGLSAPGRWHTTGRRIVYCAPNPATALLDVLINAKVHIEDVPVEYRYLEIEPPDALAIEDADTSALGPAWRTDLEATRRAGDEWLRSSRTALFRVPSVIVPAAWKVLINPQHPDSAQALVVRIHPYGFDPRRLGSPDLRCSRNVTTIKVGETASEGGPP
jgi:RES domain-containing protein